MLIEQPNPPDLFDEWAPRYDAAVENEEEFPFAGYDEILEAIVRAANAETGMDVLDLGTGTGNLAQRFVALHCNVVGTDFSPRMLDEARYKVPDATFVQADLLETWPGELDRRFDRIVSSYLFHEWSMAQKVEVLQRLAQHHLQPEGIIVIGDIAFRSEAAREEGQRRWSGLWDEGEFYWAADEAIIELLDVDLDANYRQISSCGGIFTIEPMARYYRN